jgi:signal transduction histidine kinase
VEVADTGIGIEEKALGRIFDEFYRSEAARANTADGSGLGLAIVKAVVEQHGGTIDVESEVGRGTRFRVSIPMARNG